MSEKPSQFPIGPSISAIVIGLMGLLANTTTIWIIRKNKKLHSSCFVLIGGAACGSLLSGLGNVINIGSGLGDQLEYWSLSNRTGWECYLTNTYPLGFLGYLFNSMAVVSVAMDRLFGTMAPIKYRLMGIRYVISVLSIDAIFSVIMAVILIICGGSLSVIKSNCAIITQVIGDWSLNIFNATNLTLNIFCVLSYSAMFISGYMGKWRMKHKVNGGFASQIEFQSYLKQQAAITPAARMLAILYIFTAVVPQLVFRYFTVGGVPYNIALQLFTTCVLVEFVALSSRCKEFRNDLRRLFNHKQNQVVSIVGQAGPIQGNIVRM